ncbi:MAG: pinensin family lanthipeptide [Bacteroidota bacterium]
MKKNKLRLDELKVKSFVTQDDEALEKTIKGGIGSIVDLPNDPIKNPIDTILCQPTPGTWCYICPVDRF